MGWIFFRYSTDDIYVPFGWTIVILALLESAVLPFIYPLADEIGGILTGNASYSAILISCAICFVFSQLDDVSLTKRRLIGYLCILGGLAGGLLLTGSRATYVGLMVALLLFWKKKMARRILLLGAGGGILFLSLHPHFLWKLLEVDLANLSSSFHEYYGGRWIIWKAALSALKERWFLGYGLGNFEAAYLLHQGPTKEILQYGKITQFAHNDFLQIAVAAGLPALGLLLWGVINVLRSLFPLKKLSWAYHWALSVIVLFGVSSLLNFNFFLPFNGLVFCACFGILMRKNKGKKISPSLMKATKVSMNFLSIFFFLYLILFGLSEKARIKKHYDLGKSLMPIRADLWAESAIHKATIPSSLATSSQEVIESQLKKALKLNPDDPFLWSKYGLIMGVLSPSNQDEISSAFAKAKALAPKHAPFWVQEGLYHFQQGAMDKAKENFDMAAKLEPNAPRPKYHQGLVALKLGNKEAAKTFFSTSLDLYEKHYQTVRKSPYAEFLFAIDPQKIETILKSL